MSEQKQNIAVGRYQITGEGITYTDEYGIDKGVLEVGSFQVVPTILGDEWVKLGHAIKTEYLDDEKTEEVEPEITEEVESQEENVDVETETETPTTDTEEPTEPEISGDDEEIQSA